MNGLERTLRGKKFDISFQNKLMISSYHNLYTPASNLFNSAKFKNEGIRKKGNNNK